MWFLHAPSAHVWVAAGALAVSVVVANANDLLAIPPMTERNQFEELFVPIEHICDGFDEEWSNCGGLPECGPCTPLNCAWGAWGDWTDAGGCSGLHSRQRRIVRPANHCGVPCSGAKEETGEFTKDECTAHGVDCKFSQWSAWSACKNAKDQQIRMRRIVSPPGKGGAACSGHVEETQPCGGPKKHDCKFGKWQSWTSCSATCGEGRHTRMRRIISEESKLGDACAGMTLMTEACEVVKCVSQDCQLSDWEAWSSCTDEHMQKFRERQVMQAPTGGGRPCDRVLSQTNGCPQVQPTDCQVTSWQPWGECDKSCGGGQKYRHREISSPAVDGGHCSAVELKETEACNSQTCFAEPDQDCEFTEWDSWSQCSASCGPGSVKRSRQVKSYAAAGGDGCKGSLDELSICSNPHCDRSDCAWSEWEEWSSCSCSCGGGAKHRSRQIAVSPLNGGKACEPNSKGEVAPCNSQPCGEGCIDGVWGQWREWTQCSATCEPSYKSRRRNVEVYPNKCGKAPDGFSEEFTTCKNQPSCTADRDCEVADWGEWSHCSCHCYGVRERNRFISEFAAGQGKPCLDSLKQVEPCNPGVGEPHPGDCSDKPSEDCVMGEWAEYSRCSATCGGGQKEKKRMVLAPSMNGGTACNAELTVTEPCNTQACPVFECMDCLWGDWGEWSEPEKCGGQKYRQRNIERMPNACGKRCEPHSAKEVTGSAVDCHSTQYCTWSEWSESDCSGCGETTSMRNRALMLKKHADDYLFRTDEGAKCAGTQLNQSVCPVTRSCSNCQPVNCKFAAWEQWGPPSCQGLCERSRVIAAMNNECGEPCAGSLLQTMRCPTECEHPTDCKFSDWQPWKECPTNTINGQRFREKIIVQKPSHGGKACQGVISETTGCNVDAPESCHFSEWSRWSECSQTCGVGFHTRTRTIATPARSSGFPCVGKVKEIKHCEEWDATHCGDQGKLNCKLADWGAWTACAMGGQRYRDRSISQQASADGEPCVGTLHETETCALNKVDCRLSAWTEWDQCDRQCGKGQAHRQRQIHQFPQNGGRACKENMMETTGCELQKCFESNCVLGLWADWTLCSSPCGPGMQMRSRIIESLRDPGGKGYNGALGETRSCLDNPICEAADCEWDDWGEFDACTASCGGGVMTKHRRIKNLPKEGGKECEAHDLTEVAPCNTHPCGAGVCQDGAWADWQEWSPCSASCDGGTTFRIRTMAKMANECGCPPHGKEHQTAFCNVKKPCAVAKDCQFTKWSGWSVCSASCDGVTRRTRQIAAYGAGIGVFCEGAMQQVYPCNPSTGGVAPEGCMDGPREDCVLSSWRSWSLCSATCGGGQHVRSRFTEKHARNGGRPCDAGLSEIRECRRNDCNGPEPIDCQLADWHDWGECDQCNGEKKRHRGVSVYPKHGGRECDPVNITQVGKCDRRCHEQKYCVWDDWGKWTQCTATCGNGGKKRRRRYLHLKEAGADAPMQPDRVNEMLASYDTLNDRVRALESIHLDDVIMSFLAGCVTLTAAMAAVRCFLVSRRQQNPNLRGYTRFQPPAALDASMIAPNTYHHLHEVNGTELE